MWVGNQDCRASSCGELEDRASRASEDQVACRQTVTQVRFIVENYVAPWMTLAIQDAFDLPVVAKTGHVDHLIVPIGIEGETLDGCEIDRASTVTTTEDQQAGSPFGQPQTSASWLAVSLENALANRATGYLRPISTKIGNGKGQAYSVRPATQHPGREARASISLHQDQGQATQASSNSDGAGDETPSPQYHSGFGPGQEPRGAGNCCRGPDEGPECPQGVLPIESLDLEQLDRVSGIPDEVPLGTATRACEKDVPAPVTKRVGDGQGGYDVPRRPAGRDHDRIHL